MTDEKIQRGLARGERAACEALVRKYHEGIFSLLWAETGDRDDAMDLAQETFLAVWRRPERTAGADNLEAWLCGIALRLARQARWRARHRSLRVRITRVGLGPPPAVPEDHLEGRLERIQLWEAMRRLPARYRDPLLLFVTKDLSHREVAAVLSVSEDCVRWRVSEARRRLREALKPSPTHEESRGARPADR